MKKVSMFYLVPLVLFCVIFTACSSSPEPQQPSPQPPGTAPTVTLAAQPQEGIAPLTVTFTATATDHTGAPLTYFWAYGNGDTNTSRDPQITYTYRQPGTYTARVRVSNGQAESGAEVVITVNESQPDDSEPEPDPEPTQYELTVTKAGDGIGSVIGPGIDCGSDCSGTYDEGAQVTLTAIPISGSTFAGWSGACQGTGDCTVTMDSDKTVTATFELVPPPPPPAHLLTVIKDGDGEGVVISSPEGISCGQDCSESFEEGTEVMLTAEAAEGSTFAGWGGACSGTGTCAVTADSDKRVIATFNLLDPEPEPEPPPPPPPGKLDFIQSSLNAYCSPSGYYRVAGELVNGSSQTHYFVQVRGTFRNTAGNVIDTGFTFAKGTPVKLEATDIVTSGFPPGQRGAFDLNSLLPCDQVADHSLTITSDTEKTASVAGHLELRGSVTISTDHRGDAKLTGEVVNRGSATTAFTQIYAVLKDAEGRVLSLDFTFAQGSTCSVSGVSTSTCLEPGATAPFEITTFTERSKVADFYLLFDWNE